MAGNPYETDPQMNAQSENRMNIDPNYPNIPQSQRQPYPPVVNQPYPPQQPYPSQQPYPQQPYQQPYHPQQPYPPPQPYPIVIQQNQMMGTVCPYCNQVTQSYTYKDIGGITWIWCCVLFVFTGICCWIPFVCDDCKQDYIKCARCHATKAII